MIKNKKNNASGWILFAVVVGLIVLFSLMRPSFFQFSNLVAISMSMASLVVLGIGSTMVLTTGEIDISIGALMSVGPCIIAVLTDKGMPALFAFIIALLVVAAHGALSGLLVTKVGLPSFIATFGVQGIAMGLSRTLTGNSAVELQSDISTEMFRGKIGDFSSIVVWMIVLLAIGWFMLYKLKFGRYLHAVGDNPEAAVSYGLNIGKYKMLAFVSSSVFAFFAGMMEGLRGTFVEPGFGESLMLNSIVIAIIGGTRMQGGKSSIVGMFVAAVFVTIVSNGLFHMAVSPSVQNLTVGAIIIVVLSVNAVIENNRIELKRS